VLPCACTLLFGTPLAFATGIVGFLLERGRGMAIAAFAASIIPVLGVVCLIAGLV